MKYTQHPLSAAFPSINAKWDFAFDGQAWEGRCADALKIAVVRPAGDDLWTFCGIDVAENVEHSTKRPCGRLALEMHLQCFGVLPEDGWQVAEHSRSMAEINEMLNRGQTQVYFVRAGQFIKIGFSCDVRARVDSFRIGCPYEIELLGTVLGGAKKEHEFHRRFRDLHYRGEWFRLDGELAEYVREEFEVTA